MKYARLTKEQLEELHPEFINFLASQSIDKSEWDEIKSKRPKVAEQEIDVFSDLIWEGVLTKAEFLENFSPHFIFLFRCGDSHLHSIIVQSLRDDIDLTSPGGIRWLSDNLLSDDVEIVTGKKLFSDRNSDIFQLIRQGAVLSDGELYKNIEGVIRG